MISTAMFSGQYVLKDLPAQCNEAASLQRHPSYRYRPTASKISKIFDMSHFGVTDTRWPVGSLHEV
jgi:hypothetical protein